MLLCHDVVDVEWQFGKSFWKAAVLAAISCAIPDSTLNRLVHDETAAVS